ncbi:MAG: SxtJ family membrane protein [Planctomycetota bacterium]
MLKLDLNPPTSQLRQFGWIALIGFPAVGAMFTWGFSWTPVWLFWVLCGLGVVMGLCALAKADAIIKPVFIALMVVSLPIGWVISNVLLGAIYFGMFMPVGLLFRATGRDKLNRQPDPSVDSYWHVRDKPRAPASYLRLY